MIRVSNPSPSPSRHWIRTVLPTERLADVPDRGWLRVAEGEYGPLPPIPYVLGHRCQAGRTIFLRPTLPPGMGPRILELDRGRTDPPNIPPALSADELADPAGAFGIPPTASLYRPDAPPVRVPLDIVASIEEGPCRSMLFRARLAPMVVAEVSVEFYPDQAAVPGTLRWVFAGTDSTVREEFTMLRVEFGDFVVPRFSGAIPCHTGADAKSLEIRGPSYAGRGQRIVVPFTMILDQRLKTEDDYTETHAFLVRPAWADGFHGASDWSPCGPRPYATRDRGLPFIGAKAHGLFTGSPKLWERNIPDLGRPANSRTTGEHEDWGASKGEMLSVDPAASLIYLAVACQEAKRPNAMRETADPIGFDRPGLVLWDGVPHYHPGVGSDKLGIPPGTWLDLAGDWTGPDRQHWSINNLAAAYLSNPSPGLLIQLQEEALVWFYSQTVDPGLTTSGTGEPRGQGRALQVGAWLCWLLPEDSEDHTRVRERLQERVELVYKPHLKRMRDRGEISPLGLTQHPLAMTELAAEAERAWMPWQDAIGFIGYYAAARVLDDSELLELLIPPLVTFARYGWWTEGQGWVVGKYVGEVTEGVALTEAQYKEERIPKLCVAYGGFNRWAAAGIEVFLKVADRFQSQEMEDLRSKVMSIRGEVRKANQTEAYYQAWTAF